MKPQFKRVPVMSGKLIEFFTEKGGYAGQEVVLDIDRRDMEDHFNFRTNAVVAKVHAAAVVEDPITRQFKTIATGAITLYFRDDD